MALGSDTPIIQSITGNTATYLADTQMSAVKVSMNADSNLTAAKLTTTYKTSTVLPTNHSSKQDQPISVSAG